MDQGGEAIDSSWTVALEAALFGSQQSGALTGTNSNGFSGATEGDQDMMGDWDGRFFGDAATPGNQSTLPSAVAGTFDAQFTNGAVIGSFGAEKDD